MVRADVGQLLLAVAVFAAFPTICPAALPQSRLLSSNSLASAVGVSLWASLLVSVGGDARSPKLSEFDKLVEFLNFHMFGMGSHALVYDRSRDAFVSTSTEQKMVCFMGVGEYSAELFEIFVQYLPQIDMLVLNAGFANPDYGDSYFQQLEGRFPARILHSTVSGYGGTCDILVTSLDAPMFTFQSVEDIMRRVDYGAVVFDMAGCVGEQRDPINLHTCDFLLSNWRLSICGSDDEEELKGFVGCDGSLCMCFMRTQAVMDPVYVPVNCSGFVEVPDESFHGTSQWHQDWFLYHNFLKYLPPRQDGLYVDVGSNDPFLLSSTVAFEQCFGWEGVCIEPNPRLVHGLSAYRSCTVFPVCVWNETVAKEFATTGASEHSQIVADATESAPDQFFSPKEAYIMDRKSFSATCHPLQDVLSSAGLKGRRIDFLSVDVEHGEIEVFSAFPFHDWDIRMIVVETNRDTSFAVDVLMLTNSFSKVALLGKDAVYAHQRLISEVVAARGFFALEFPKEMQHYRESYEDFQRRFLTGNFVGEDEHF